MFSLLVEYSAQGVRAAETVAGPSWWMRLMRTIVDAYRDLGLDRAGIEHAVRFGRG